MVNTSCLYKLEQLMCTFIYLLNNTRIKGHTYIHVGCSERNSERSGVFLIFTLYCEGRHFNSKRIQILYFNNVVHRHVDFENLY